MTEPDGEEEGSLPDPFVPGEARFRQHLRVLYRGSTTTGRPELLETLLAALDLRGADLTGADLTGADLTGADLTDANLTDANLTDANLTDANLTDANLTDARWLPGHPPDWGRLDSPKDSWDGSTSSASVQNLQATPRTSNAAEGRQALSSNLEPFFAMVERRLEDQRLSDVDAARVEHARRALRQELWENPDEPSPLVISAHVEMLLHTLDPYLPVTTDDVAPRLRISTDVDIGATASARAERVTDFLDVASLVEALLPAFAEPSRSADWGLDGGGSLAGAIAETVAAAAGEAAAAAAAAAVAAHASFTVQAMRYENSLALDLPIALPPAAVGAAEGAGAALKYQGQLRKTIDWIAGWKENRAAQKKEARTRLETANADISKARAHLAEAELDEELARVRLIELRRESGAPLDQLPPGAARTLQMIVDNDIEIEIVPLEPLSRPPPIGRANDLRAR